MILIINCYLYLLAKYYTAVVIKYVALWSTKTLQPWNWPWPQVRYKTRDLVVIKFPVGVRYESGHFLPPRKKLAHSNTYSLTFYLVHFIDYFVIILCPAAPQPERLIKIISTIYYLVIKDLVDMILINSFRSGCADCNRPGGP
jgi:hypothetical protein